MSRNIVFEGWLTKSPPSKRIWRTKWRRRWFALRQSGELPGQYFLDYYADRNCRRLKGTINLDLCEQVDAGLHMERAGNGTLDPKLRGSVFTIQTQSRTYHLEADCEAEMASWVDAICRVCGLRSTDDDSDGFDAYLNNRTAVSATSDRYERANTTGPYIPISECITGVRAPGQQTTFTFEPRKNVTSSQKETCDKFTETSGRQIYVHPPRIRVTCEEFSENESNLSDEDCKPLNISPSNLPDWSVTKTFTKLTVSPNNNGNMQEGPPVPPRPPKTLPRPKCFVQNEKFQGPKVQEPGEAAQESVSNNSTPGTPYLHLLGPSSAPQSPARVYAVPFATRHTDDEEEYSTRQQAMQYCNLPSLPPAIDRALKPRFSSHSVGHINNFMAQKAGFPLPHPDEFKADTLQYLDLDLHTSTPATATNSELPIRSTIIHGKSMSAVEDKTVYKTVDFLKTEAFNITRQDAEASRSYQN